MINTIINFFLEKKRENFFLKKKERNLKKVKRCFY